MKLKTQLHCYKIVQLIFGAIIFLSSSLNVDAQAGVPDAHFKYIQQVVTKASDACGEISIAMSEDRLKAQVSQLTLKGDLRISVYQKTYDCFGKGDFWSATGTVETIILIRDEAYKATLTAPPRAVQVQEQSYLWLYLDASACSFTDALVIVQERAPCVAVFSWDDDLNVFYGQSHVLEFLGQIDDY